MSSLRHISARFGLTLAAALCATAARADDVVLKNGNTFDGVIVVSEDDERVRIRLAYGEMSLPRSWIDHIERSESPLEGYLDRRAALRGRADAGADDWLALARWARSRELEHGYKESLLEAALIEPRHPEASRYLRALGFVLDESTQAWISAAEMRRAQAAEEERRLAAAQRARRLETREEDLDGETQRSLGRALEALALAELERETRTSDREERSGRSYHPFQVGTYGFPAVPIYYPPVVVTAPTPADGEPAAQASPPRDPYAVVRSRLPGSLLVNRSSSGDRMSSQSRPRLPGSLLSSRPR